MTAVSVHDILIRPVISEKSVAQTERNNYTFAVGRDANKFQIKQAVEQIYNVKVVDVRTMTRKGKPRRSKYKVVHGSNWKRAIVILDEKSRIDLF